MEQGFQSLILDGNHTTSDYYLPPITFSGDTYFTNLTTHPKPLLPPPTHPYTSPQYPFDENTLTKCTCTCKCPLTGQTLKRLKPEPSPDPFPFPFNRLPKLQSLEQIHHSNHFTPATIPAPSTVPAPAPAKLTRRDLEHKRRHAITDKTRALQNLIPAEKKMDMATVYEEAYKYIKFLQAQISVMESMPDSLNFGYGYGKNRWEVLCELVNSRAGQAVMYSSGCCVYSVEQLVVVKEVMEKGLFVSDYGF